MSTIAPDSGPLKQAITWISEQRQQYPEKPPVELAQEAGIRFDLNLKDSEFLLRFVKDDGNQDPS